MNCLLYSKRLLLSRQNTQTHQLLFVFFTTAILLTWKKKMCDAKELTIAICVKVRHQFHRISPPSPISFCHICHIWQKAAVKLPYICQIESSIWGIPPPPSHLTVKFDTIRRAHRPTQETLAVLQAVIAKQDAGNQWLVIERRASRLTADGQYQRGGDTKVLSHFDNKMKCEMLTDTIFLNPRVVGQPWQKNGSVAGRRGPVK